MPFKWRGSFLCFYCGAGYTQYQAFSKHTRSHGLCSTSDYPMKLIKGNFLEIKIDVSKIECELCMEPFNSFNEIVQHLINKHDLDYDKNIETPMQAYRLVDYKCLICEQQFTYFGFLINHVNKMHPNNCFVCDECGLTFNKKRDLARHFRNYHCGRGYSCDQCSKTFENNLLLRKHEKHFHFTKCKLCDLAFPNALIRKHNLSDHPKKSTCKCDYCLKVCHSQLGLQQHLTKCKLKKVDNEEPMSTFDVVNSKEPQKNQNVAQIRRNIQCVLSMSTATPFKYFSKYYCFYCSEKFIDFDELKMHTISEHPILDIDSQILKKIKGERTSVKIDIAALACKICSQPMEDLKPLIDHLVTEHDAEYDLSLPRCFEPFKMFKDRYTCSLCPNSVFRYFPILLRHVNSEHSNNDKMCDSCGRSFRKTTNLRMHINHAHNVYSKCELCEAKFRNQAMLARHKAKCHDVKEHKCSKCSEQFPSQYQKQKHLIKVHNDGHKCSYCGKLFTRNSFMKDHVRRTHLKEKNVPCSICNEKFFDNHLLRLHMVKHDGERKFKCTICDKAFLRKSNLYTHNEMHKKYGHLQT